MRLSAQTSAYVDDFLSNVTVWNISQQQED